MVRDLVARSLGSVREPPAATRRHTAMAAHPGLPLALACTTGGGATGRPFPRPWWPAASTRATAAMAATGGRVSPCRVGLGPASAWLGPRLGVGDRRRRQHPSPAALAGGGSGQRRRRGQLRRPALPWHARVGLVPRAVDARVRTPAWRLEAPTGGSRLGPAPLSDLVEA